MSSLDACIVGSGPNGLSCAIALAQKGLKVEIHEVRREIGGAVKSAELTLPGFTHDVFSSCYPMAVLSPFFKTLPLEKQGLKWIYSPYEVAHPLDGGDAVVLSRSVEATASTLGRDAKQYQKIFGPLVKSSSYLMDEIMGPVIHRPKHLITLARFGLHALHSAEKFANIQFKDERAKALWAGIAAHASIPLDWPGSSASGLVLNIAGHTGGWPIAEGGSRNLTLALSNYFQSLGGKIVTDTQINKLTDLPESRFVFFDLTPSQIIKIAGEALPSKVSSKLREYKYGPGVFKLDWALDGPIPWANPNVAKSITVHLGGKFFEISLSEKTVFNGEPQKSPYVLLTQPSLFDSTRAPTGKHTAWAYCHIPNGSTVDMTLAIENQVERFAPGFKSLILKRHTMGPKQLENLNPNLIGGDISGGLVSLRQLLFRPTTKLNPYALDGKKYFICSSSTPPGPGVHGMCGFQAAQSVL